MNTETQLREMLDTYADLSDDNPVRAGEIRRAVVHRRNRRGAVAGAVSLVLVATAVGLPLVARHGGTSQLRSVSPQPAHQPYPEYADGGRVLGGGDLTTTRDGLSILNVFTPTSYQLQLDISCTGPSVAGAPVNFDLDVAVNGRAVNRLTGGCTAYSSGNLSDVQQSMRTWGHVVRLGQQNTLTVTLAPGQDGQQVPANLYLTAATYQAVPFDAYPLPRRPATLTPLVADNDGTVVLEARKVGAEGPHTFTATAGTEDVLDLITDGPGLLEVAVDGRHIATVGSFDWLGHDGAVSLTPDDLAADGLTVRDGQRVTVTLTGSHFSGPEWLVTDTHY